MLIIYCKDEELPVNFTEAELREGCKRCIDNVKGLLESALLLLHHKSSQQYGLCMRLKNLEKQYY
jgi:hypothetical protein